MLTLAALVDAACAVAATRARQAKTDALAAALRAAAPDEVETVVAWLSGRTLQGALGLGGQRIATVARDVPSCPDSTLTVAEVERALVTIAVEHGTGARARRETTLAALLARATAAEVDFLVRLLAGALRQGALEGVMADAVARAYEIPVAVVRRAAMLRGDLAGVAAVAARGGAQAVAGLGLQLMRPLQPMLAQSAADSSEVLDAFGRAGFEAKLDGARVQVHRDGDRVAVFSRRLRDVTASVPELVETVRALPARAVVLDGEVLAWSADDRPLPFQVTMRRFGRGEAAAADRAALPLRAFFFDCLHLDGEDWLDLPAVERAAGLRRVVSAPQAVPRLETDAPPAADAFLEEVLATGFEGVVAKALDAPYEAGRRGASWRKIKPVHTLDLVVLAAEWGSGRRRGWLSNLHLGARDPDGGFVMLGKTFKGMTDALLRWQTDALQERAIGIEGHVVRVRPELVVEIAFDGVQHSPQYPGGVALRFARVRRYRPDKTAAEADTLEAVRRFLPS